MGKIKNLQNFWSESKK